MISLDRLLPEQAMSSHYIAGHSTLHKTGRPGTWKLEQGAIMDAITMESIIEHLLADPSITIETQTKTTLIAQIGRYRVVHTRPPLSKHAELTLIRSKVITTLDAYRHVNDIKKRLSGGQGVLIAGSPGQGKSTFVSALITELSASNIIKTVESPRDLIVPANVTQLSYQKDTDMTRDLLLLSRPDIVCIDELRHTKDFGLFADLRLCGIGCFGVMHATKAVDAVARFIRHVDFGSLAHTLDTVIFINNGDIQQILDISMEMKIPTGLKSKDLTRPVIAVKDLHTQELLYELFSFADQIIIHDPRKQSEAEPDVRTSFLEQYMVTKNIDATIQQEGNLFHITIPKDQYDATCQLVEELEKKTGSTIHIHTRARKEQVPFVPILTAESVGIRPESDQECTIYIDGQYLLCGRPSKKGIIQMKANSDQAKRFVDALKNGKHITVIKNT